MKKLYIILFFFNIFFINDLYSQKSIENEYKFLRQKILSSENISEAIIEVDDFFGFDTSFARQRLTSLIDNYTISNKYYEFDRMISVVNYLNNFNNISNLNYYSGNLPYSMIVKNKNWNCVSIASDFQSLSSYEKFTSNMMTFSNHAINLTYLDGREWVVYHPKDRSFQRYANEIRDGKRIFSNLDRKSYYKVFKRDEKKEKEKSKLHGVPLNRVEFIAEYLIDLCNYFDQGSKSDLRGVDACRLSLMFYPDHDKALFYLAKQYFLLEELDKVEQIVPRIKAPFYRWWGDELIRRIDEYRKKLSIQ